jgi:hypothetical protein
MNGAAAYAAELCRLWMLLLLAAAAIGKASAREGFEATLGGMLGWGPRASRFGAIAIVAAEGGLALLLLAGGRWAEAGMAGAVLLLGAFSVAIATALHQRRRVRCNCFGGGGKAITAFDLARNGALVGAGVFYLMQNPRAQGLDPAGWALLAGCALILLLVSLNLDEIAAAVR